CSTTSTPSAAPRSAPCCNKRPTTSNPSAKARRTCKSAETGHAEQAGKEARASFEIAKLLDEVADAIRTRSNRAYAAGRMALDDYVDSPARELELRSELSLIVAPRLGDAIAQAADAGEDIEQAVRDA